MTTLTPQRINDLIEQREALTNRRDEHIDFAAVDAIDAQLATVPAGVNNTLDLRLGRPSAVLPERVEYNVCRTCNGTGIYAPRGEYLGSCPTCQRPETDTASATEEMAAAAQKKQSEHDAYLESIADQFSDWLDWHRICGDLAI